MFCGEGKSSQVLTSGVWVMLQSIFSEKANAGNGETQEQREKRPASIRPTQWNGRGLLSPI